jgi:hypothetical protein
VVPSSWLALEEGVWCNRGNYKCTPEKPLGGFLLSWLGPLTAEREEAELRLSQMLHLEDAEAGQPPGVGSNRLVGTAVVKPAAVVWGP